MGDGGGTGVPADLLGAVQRGQVRASNAKLHLLM